MITVLGIRFLYVLISLIANNFGFVPFTLLLVCLVSEDGIDEEEEEVDEKQPDGDDDEDSLCNRVICLLKGFFNYYLCGMTYCNIYCWPELKILREREIILIISLYLQWRISIDTNITEIM